MARQGPTRFWITWSGFSELKAPMTERSVDERAVLSDLSTSSRGLTPGIIAKDIGWTSEVDPKASSHIREVLEGLESEGLVTKSKKEFNKDWVGRAFPLPYMRNYPEMPAVFTEADEPHEVPWELDLN